MRRTSVVRFLTSLIIASLTLAGPLAPLAHGQETDQPVDSAQAQPTDVAQARSTDSAQAQPTDTAQAQPTDIAQAPPAPVTQPAPAVQPARPDIFQETLKQQRASDRSQALYNMEAVVVSVFLFPGRVITCAAGTVVGLALLTVSLGSGYRTATGLFHEGCGGKWIVTGDDLRPDVPPSLVVTDPGR